MEAKITIEDGFKILSDRAAMMLLWEFWNTTPIPASSYSSKITHKSFLRESTAGGTHTFFAGRGFFKVISLHCLKFKSWFLYESIGMAMGRVWPSLWINNYFQWPNSFIKTAFVPMIPQWPSCNSKQLEELRFISNQHC